ncbi:MAG TPA: caspase family protein, partial [Steroidobacteraceae bacterium]|nr:caspase family protein [Steroidobacteraceae bacterium]
MSTQHPRSLRKVSLIGILAYGLIGVAVTAAVRAAVPDTTPAPPTDVSQPAQAASPAATPDEAAGRGAMVPAARDAGAPEKRLALVIGNSTYREAPLVNPYNDARAMAIKLKELGFTVMEKENANLEEMRKLVRDFGNQLQFSDVGLFYYAGHGIQSAQSVNYLIPVDADIQDETELASRAFSASEVQEKMTAAKNRINVVILDACRNDPLARKVRSAGRGLAPMEEGSGTIVEFATSPGSTSADGEGANGLYTSEILDALSEPGLSVEEVFKRVRMGVSQKSGGEQIPWEHSSLLGDFYFNPTTEQRARMGAGTALIRPMTASAGGGGRSREFIPVLVPRRLLENYELNANVALSAPILVGEFTPDAHRFVMVTQDRQLKVLDVANGNVVFTHAGFDAPSLSADGRYLIGVSDEHLVNVLDATADSVAVKTYRAAADVQSAYMSPNDQRLVAVSHTGAVSVIKMETDTVIGAPLKLEGDLTVQFAPGVNRAAVTTSKSGELALLDLDTGKRIGRSSAHRKPIQLLRFSHDGSLVLTAADADAAYVWRTADGSKIARLNIGDESALPGQAEFMDDGKRVLLNVSITEKQGGTHYRLGTWDVASGKALLTLLADA